MIIWLELKCFIKRLLFLPLMYCKPTLKLSVTDVY